MNKLEIVIVISYSCQSYANLIDTILTPNLIFPNHSGTFFTLWVFFPHDFTSDTSFVGGSVIGHGLVLLLSIAKCHNLLNSQSLGYDGDRQAPPDLLNLLPE
jgi:hypothetical protein